MRENKARPEAAAIQSSCSQREGRARTGEVLDSSLGLRPYTVGQDSFPLTRKSGRALSPGFGGEGSKWGGI